DATGFYDVGELAAGTYRVDFTPADPGHVYQAYNGKTTLACGEDVVVAGGQTISGIDAALRPPTLTYTAGSHGSIDGSSTQAVACGDNGTTVTAVPSAGYHFTGWSDGVKTATRADTNVTANINVTADFAISPVLSTTTRLSGSSKARVKRSLKLTGTISYSAAPGRVTITMSRKVGRRWRSAGKATVSVSHGSFSYSFKPRYRGSWHFVAKYTGGMSGFATYKLSTSKTKSVTVR
ncbi:MAG TPA: hypothetical protein VIL41_05660, partial [Coriobacteriia bacterium]